MKLRRYNCKSVRDMIPLHVGGDLDARHVDAVDEHLHSCLACFREFREFATMRGRLGVLAEEPLPEGVLDGFAEEVMARIAVGDPGPAASPPAPVSVLSRWRRVAAAAAVILVAALGLHGVGGSPFGLWGEAHPLSALRDPPGLTLGTGLDDGEFTMAGPLPVRRGERDGPIVAGETPRDATPVDVAVPGDGNSLVRSAWGRPSELIGVEQDQFSRPWTPLEPETGMSLRPDHERELRKRDDDR